MTTTYDAAWKRASGAIDRVYGEPFIYQPMKQPDAGGRFVPDTARGVPASITAALSETPLLIDPIGKRTASNTVVSNAGDFRWIDLADDVLGYLCRNGDRLLRVKDNQIFEVSGVFPDGIARTVLRVVQFRGRS